MDESPLLGHTLPQLGTSAEAVASTLRKHGIKGVRNTTHYLNPIVRFVQTQLRLDDYQLSVECGDAMHAYVLRILLPDAGPQEARFPRPVKEFLDLFNAGHYSDLEITSPQ